MPSDFRDSRREYQFGELHRADLNDSPLSQFLAWMDDVIALGVPDGTAMTLATATRDGIPSVRTVLLKQADTQGFLWFTDKRSQKGCELSLNPHAELLFYWPALQRQVRVSGRVHLLLDSENDAYFNSRPEGSRFSAAASLQSSNVENRHVLENRVAELRAQYPEGDVPRPAEWGGYRLMPSQYEFWQGRESRLHDRFTYSRSGESWVIRRVSP